ncbi:MAG TPA: 50S ribosomal protein L18 [Candidatus Binataceae bacterium]|nr:50S ribosomal protein L18 [Candidatus Binataceae bacterium]
MAALRSDKRKLRRERIRAVVRGDNRRPRLSIYRSLHHIYVQVISDENGRTLASASTQNADLRDGLKSKRNLAAAKAVGTAIASKCKAVGIESVIFDRNGFLYHGRVKALAEAARAAGLKF